MKAKGSRDPVKAPPGRKVVPNIDHVASYKRGLIRSRVFLEGSPVMHGVAAVGSPVAREFRGRVMFWVKQSMKDGSARFLGFDTLGNLLDWRAAKVGE